jgi:TRAP-type C4-dicarboxylate transport system substrate-binding protein
MRIVTRRQFLRDAGIGGATLVISGARPLGQVAAADVPTRKGVSYFPPAYSSLRYAIMGFVQQLKGQLGNELKVEFFDSASLLKADEQVPALRVGTIQFMFHTSTYISGEFPILGIVELPGLCERVFEHGERLAMESPLWKLINNELAKGNLFMLTAGAGILEPEYIWSGKKRIVSLADLQGKRCRVVGREAMDFLSGFGVIGARIPSEQAYLALQRGSVDAVLANINTIVARNLYEQLQFCLKIPVTSAAISIFVLKDYWDKMPDKEKAAFWEAGKWYDLNQRMGYAKLTQEEAWPVVKKAGVQIVHPTDGDRGTFAAKSRPVWASWKARVGEELGQQAIDLASGRE